MIKSLLRIIDRQRCMSLQSKELQNIQNKLHDSHIKYFRNKKIPPLIGGIKILNVL